MNDDQLHRAALDMERGQHGSFAACIGQAYIVADNVNRAKLAAAFPDLFARVHAFNQPKLEIIK